MLRTISHILFLTFLCIATAAHATAPSPPKGTRMVCPNEMKGNVCFVFGDSYKLNVDYGRIILEMEAEDTSTWELSGCDARIRGYDKAGEVCYGTWTLHTSDLNPAKIKEMRAQDFKFCLTILSQNGHQIPEREMNRCLARRTYLRAEAKVKKWPVVIDYEAFYPSAAN